MSTPALSLREHLAWLAGIWRGNRSFLPLLLLFTLVSSAVAIAYPLVFREIVDALRLPDGAGDLSRLMTILAVIAAGHVVRGLYPGFRAWINLRIERAVRERVFASILAKDHTFRGRFRTGDLVTRLTDDIAEYPRIAWFSCSGIFRFLDSGARFLFCVAVMLWLDPGLALLALLPVPLMLWVFYLARRELGVTYQQQQEAVSETNNVIEAAFSGIRIVKAFNGAAGQEQRLAGVLRERIGIQLRLAKLVVFVHEMDNVAGRLGQVVVLAVGGLRVLDGSLGLGTLYAIYLYLDLLIHPMMDLPNLFVTARQAFVSMDREEEVLRHPAAERRGEEGGDPGPLESLALRDLGFSWREDLPPALEGVSLDVPRGRRVAVVGPVASGKSTLLEVLAGLLPPGAGSYEVNGRDFHAWSWPALRARIGYVPQDARLFSDTIRENVAFGRSVDAATVRRSLEIAQMGPDLEGMPEGLATRLGRAGTLVSGGQKQRIAIARALAGRPDLLLLDDCTASLDAQNEDRFWSALDAALPDTTVVFVSHRPATIRRADHVVVLDRGRVEDQGAHADLAARCRLYGDLLRAEALREDLGAADAT